MTKDFPFEQARSLLLEYLKTHSSGDYLEVVDGVVKLAIDKRLATMQPGKPVTPIRGALPVHQSTIIKELVRQGLWQLLVQGILVFGINETKPNWPHYRLTGYGQQVIANQGAQPYDPDNFLREFQSKNPAADPVIVKYIEEAVRAFNHNCPIAASVMLGGASEKAILILHETFGNAIADPMEKKRFFKADRGGIYSKYTVLKDRLDKMVAAKTLSGQLAELVSSEIPGTFELIRRQRNSAGHPELYAGIDTDTVFLNLRVFSEYTKKVYDLIEFFQGNPAKW